MPRQVAGLDALREINTRNRSGHGPAAAPAAAAPAAATVPVEAAGGWEGEYATDADLAKALALSMGGDAALSQQHFEPPVRDAAWHARRERQEQDSVYHAALQVCPALLQSL